MENVRRWYIYLSSAVALHAVTWAVISLLRNLFAGGIRTDLEFLAFQLAVIIIGLPLYLIHWLWAQRLARQDQEERVALLRRIYLYANFAGFYSPLMANFSSLLRSLVLPFSNPEFSRFADTLNPAFAIPVLLLLLAYHYRVLREDAQVAPEAGLHGAVRRLYILAFSAAGFWLVASEVDSFLSFLFRRLSEDVVFGELRGGLIGFGVDIVIGLVIWLSHWPRAQQLFREGPPEERASAARKFYLYLVVFVSTLTTVTTLSVIFAGLLRRLLALPPSGRLSDAIAVIIVSGAAWAYHAYVLRQDSEAAPDAPRQAAVRRLYLYLVAGIGLAGFLTGLVGDVNVLLNALGSTGTFGRGLREQLASFTAALVAGLPVWLLPWRAIQAEAVEDAPEAAAHRRSLPRKIYLYLYLFAATMSVLGSLIYIVFQLLLMLLGERTAVNLLLDLAQAISFALIAGGVLAYHGSILRADGRFERAERAERLSDFSIVVLDADKGLLGRALALILSRNFPDLAITPIGLTKEAAAHMGSEIKGQSIPAALKKASLIIGSWKVAVADGGVSEAVAKVVAASPARKLLIPLPGENVDWLGVENWEADEFAVRAVSAVRQVLAGERDTYSRGLGCFGYAGIAFLVLLLVWLLFTLAAVAFGF
jgi:hypothetical protein